MNSAAPAPRAPKDYGPIVADWLAAQRARFGRDPSGRERRRNASAGALTILPTMPTDRTPTIVQSAGNDPPIVLPSIPGGFEHIK
jgi:hypothetical protein